MAANKVIYNGSTLIDLTADTVSPSSLLAGVTAHDKAGNKITGTYEELDISAETAEYTSELDTQDDLIDQIAAVLESKFVVPSTLQNKSVTPSTTKQTVTADEGYDALSTVTVEAIPQSYTNEIYQNGYNAGNEAGYESGYNAGYEIGYNAFKPYKAELDYIESDGNVCIDTLVSIDATSAPSTKVVLDTQFIDIDGYSLHGVGYGSSPYYNSLYIGIDANDKIAYGNGRTDMTTSIAYDFTRRTFTYDAPNGLISVSGLDDVSFAFQTPSEALNFLLFAYNQGTNGIKYNKSRVYGGQMHTNSVMIRDFIPVLDWEDIPCLYDKVNRRMHYGVGSGNFIAGAVKAA